MRRSTWMRRSLATWLGLAWCAGGAVPAAAQPTGSDPAAIFGPAVAPHPAATAPLARPDLDGDGKPDELWVVRLTRGGAEALASGVRAVNPFGRRGIGRDGEPLALAVRHATGARWLIHDGEFFSTPIWREPSLPLQLAKRGTRPHREAVAKGARPRGDVVLLGTEAGIDVVLHWTGSRYAVFAPDEEP